MEIAIWLLISFLAGVLVGIMYRRRTFIKLSEDYERLDEYYRRKL